MTTNTPRYYAEVDFMDDMQTKGGFTTTDAAAEWISARFDEGAFGGRVMRKDHLGRAIVVFDVSSDEDDIDAQEDDCA